MNSTNSTEIESPKLTWSQYFNFRLWIVVTGIVSSLLLPTATFTGHILTKGRIAMTDPFSVFKFLKIRRIKVYGSNHFPVVWCFANEFYVTKRWKRWACAMALWYMLSFFSSTFVLEFGVMGMFQYTIKQGPVCNDMNIWDCFVLSRTTTGYKHKSPVLSHNCSLIQEGDFVICMMIGDITLAADGLTKALGISASVTLACLFVLTVIFKLIAKICNSDRQRIYLGRGMLFVTVLLVLCFCTMTVIVHQQIFLFHAKRRFQLLNLSVLGASVSAILLLSTHGTEMYRRHLDQENIMHLPTDTTSKKQCCKAVALSIVLFLVPVILVCLDQILT
jgi:hypothetical protein